MGLIRHDLHQSPFGHTCIKKPVCPVLPIKYRRIDGSCNNFFHSIWGAALTPYARLLAPNYADGIFHSTT